MRSQPTAAATGLASILRDTPAGSLALAAAVAASAAHAQPDAVLLDLGAQWNAVQQGWIDLEAMPDHPVYPGNPRDVAGDAVFKRECDITNAVVMLPAATFAGLAVKARMLAREMDHDLADDTLFPTTDDAVVMNWAAGMMAHKDWTRSIVGSLIADLLRLALEANR